MAATSGDLHSLREAADDFRDFALARAHLHNGGAKPRASFTPVASYSGISSDLRRKLTETKIAPAPDTPVPPPQSKQSDVTAGTANRSAVRSKRAQAER